jgi:hypothetical protein
MIFNGKKVALYHEDGGIIAVEIVEDLSDEKWTKLRLRCVRTVQSSPIVRDSEVGEEFEVSRTKGPGGYCVDWFLEEEGRAVEEAFRSN